MSFHPPSSRHRAIRENAAMDKHHVGVAAEAAAGTQIQAPASVDEALAEVAVEAESLPEFVVSAPEVEAPSESEVETAPAPEPKAVAKPVVKAGMTRQELVDIAEGLGIEVDKADNKAAIISKIEAA